jgi:phage portal protein BeeE
LDLLNSPNHLLTRWALLFSMVADLLVTGRAFLWVPTERKVGRQLWPVPTSWCRPIDAFQNKWQIMPRGGQATFDPDPEEFVHLNLPDPSNPVAGALSPLQAEAEAVAADEAIQTAQYRAFSKGLFPQVLIRAGRPRRPAIHGGDTRATGSRSSALIRWRFSKSNRPATWRF